MIDQSQYRQRVFSWFVVGLAPFACGVLALVLEMDANWDLRNYHYYNAYAFLEGRHGVDYLVASIPTFFNPLIDVPFYLAAEAWPARCVGFLLGFVQGLNVVPLYGIAVSVLRLERWRAMVALAVTFLGLTGVGFLSLLGTTFYDNIVTIPPLCALWLLVARARVLSDGRPAHAVSHAVLAGVLAGTAAGLKLPSAIYAMGLPVGICAIPGSVARRVSNVVSFGCGVALGFLATGGYWAWLLWQRYGNPLFPFYNNIFKSPWALPQDYKHVFYLPREAWKRIFFPIAYAIDPSIAGDVTFADYRILAAFILLPIALLLRAWRRRSPGSSDFGDPDRTRIVFLAYAAVYIAWVTLFGIYRYALALEMLAPLVVILAIGMLPGSVRVRTVAAVVGLAAIAVSVKTTDWGRVPWSQKWVDVALPEPGPAEGALVLLTGHEPFGFLAPSFPHSARFLRIDGGFTSPGEADVAFNRAMRDIVARHDGMIYVLMIPSDATSPLNNLRAYGLAIDWNGCLTVESSIGYMPYDLCPVHRVGG